MIDVDLTVHQRRVAERIIGHPASLTDIQHYIGGAALDRPDIAASFMKKLGKRLEGSWWRLERHRNGFVIWKVTVK